LVRLGVCRGSYGRPVNIIVKLLLLNVAVAPGCSIAGSVASEFNLQTCKTDGAAKVVHEECYVLSGALKTPHNLPNPSIPTTCILRYPMTHEEREQMNRLCARIAVEKDSEVFNQLVRQLNDLLEKKHNRLSSEQQESPN
jgi:hypothetical protein